MKWQSLTAAQDAKDVVLRRRKIVRLEHLRRGAVQHIGRADDAEERFLFGAVKRLPLAELVLEFPSHHE
jgi:hypothetical protein